MIAYIVTLKHRRRGAVMAIDSVWLSAEEAAKRVRHLDTRFAKMEISVEDHEVLGMIGDGKIRNPEVASGEEV